MITFMRRYRRSLQVGLLIVIVAFVASLFIFGATGPDGAARDYVATVNGEPITTERYQRRYQEYLNTYAQILRERFSPAMAEQMGLRQQVVDDLVQEELVVQRARAEGLAASDEELNVQIHAIPAFHEGGRFTLKRYEDMLRRIGVSKSAFEEDMRRRLTRMKVEQTIRGGVRVSDAEIEQAYVQAREEVRAAWALVELAPMAAAVTPTDEELTAYHKAHGDEFRQPERRRVQYIAVNPKDFKPTISAADVEKYYAERGAEFEEPRQVRAAHILVRVPETGGSEAEDQARAKVVDGIRRAKAGEDFAKLARELSQDPGSAERGGDIGLIKKGETVPAFEQAAFALKKGEITPEPVRTPFGFHAIKAVEVREGGKKSLKDVAADIRERLAGEAADRGSRDKAEELRAKLIGATDFMAEARKLGAAPVETTIARRERAMAFTPPDPLEEATFELTLGGISAPVKTPAGWIVLKHVESLPAAVPPLGEIRDKIVAGVKREKAEAQALEKARRLVTEARTTDFATAARKLGATYGETPRFSRAKPAEKVPGDAMMAALRAPAGAFTEPVKTPPGYYVIKTLERVPPSPEGLAGEREKLSSELLTQKQSQAWESWVGAARQGAKIDVSSRLPAGRSRS